MIERLKLKVSEIESIELVKSESNPLNKDVRWCISVTMRTGQDYSRVFKTKKAADFCFNSMADCNNKYFNLY